MTLLSDKTKCSLYHIHRAGDSGKTHLGYVGISIDVQERWLRHRAGYSGSKVLNNAYKKYDDLEEEVLLEASEETCKYFEMLLRPDERIGWNLTQGGGMPPSHKGKVMTAEQKAKIGESNSGQNNIKWKGHWVIDGVRHVSMSRAAKAMGCSKRTVHNRVLNPKFPSWTFEESLTQPSDRINHDPTYRV